MNNIKKTDAGLLLVLILGGIGLYAGWRYFWFLTDDAFIAFRYVSNSILGNGYVWNPPPFHPVEGYTSFLWVVLLDGIWRVMGIEPPASANWIALIFSALTLLLGAAMVLRIRWNDRLRPYRPGILALVLVGVLTNRTFLAWTSSGLETAMFNFFVTLWLYAVTSRPASTNAGWVLASSTATTAIALTRPDGYLFMAATAFMLGITLLKARRTLRFRWFLAALPLALPIAHILWRKHFYGEWLPNTYFAKSTSWWPESGWRYATSFILEYGLWFWLAVVGFIALRHGWPKLWTACREPPTDKPHRRRTAFNLCMRLVPLLTIGAHLFYYTVLIGGDHFEYRVYSHLILLLFVALAWAVNAANWRPINAMAVMGACILLSWPVPWTLWAVEQRLNTEPREMIVGSVHIQRSFPHVARAYARVFDQMQDWLVTHYVCVRHHGHRYFWSHQAANCPSRTQGLQMSSAGYPVLSTYTVGILGWVLPKVNIIDQHGLNDYVIARTPHPSYLARRMAHEHYPPAGYVESFKPNVQIVQKKIVVTPRQQELGAADIVALERTWKQKLEEWRQPQQHGMSPDARKNLAPGHLHGDTKHPY